MHVGGMESPTIFTAGLAFITLHVGNITLLSVGILFPKLYAMVTVSEAIAIMLSSLSIIRDMGCY